MEISTEGLLATNLYKCFKGKTVLRNVSIEVARGEVVGLLGPNGAGKTTCFYSIVGLIPPDQGTIYLDGQNITSLPMYRRARLGISYLPQEMSIFRGFSVENNIRAVLEIIETSSKKREEILESLLREFDLCDLRHVSALSLSGGERRRVEIARTLACNPQFILFDEPLTGIDPIAITTIRDLIGCLRDRDIGVLITDHNVHATLEIVDRIYILYDGLILKEGKPQEIIEDEKVRQVYLGDWFQSLGMVPS